MRHPALRVTFTNNYLKLIDLFANLLQDLLKIVKNINFSFFSFFSKIELTFVRIFDLPITYRPQIWIAQIDRLDETFPEMHSYQKSNGWSSFKNWHFWRNVIDLSPAPRLTICPNTVLLFEPRMRHPALRVTFTRNYLKLIDSFANLFQKLLKIVKNLDFSFFLFFSKIELTFVRIFDLPITYRPQIWLAQIDRLDETFPKIHSYQKSNVWSSFKNWYF